MNSQEVRGASNNNKQDPSSLAKESDQTRRARQKLRERLDQLEKKVTQEALQKAVQDIHSRISLFANDRMLLNNKSIALFDENQNPAQSSNKVDKLAQELLKDFSNFLLPFPEANNSLQARSIEVR